MRRNLLAFFLICTGASSFAQKKHITYFAMYSDASKRAQLLTFQTDSTAEIRSVPRHMSVQCHKLLTYRRHGTQIDIIGDTTMRTCSGFAIDSKGLTLIRKGKALLDTNAKNIYVPYRDFETFNLLFIINGKRYVQKAAQADAYGLVKKTYRHNAALNGAMDALSLSKNNFDIHVYKGFDAYQKFGYRYVFGVIEIVNND